MCQEQKKKEKDKVAIALMLCFCVIALTSIFTIKSNVDKIKKSADNDPLPVSDQTQTDKSNAPSHEGRDSDVPKPGSQEVSSNIPTVDSNDNPSGQGGQQTSKYISPIKSGEASVTNPFAMDRLIYSITLDQYMTHCGIDVEAPEDSQVVSICEGTVTAVYADDRFGKSIEVTLSDGMKVIYSNLSTTDMVEIGDVVNQGKVIAGVGRSGPFEALEPAHLHLEMIKDGVYVNPSDYITF